MIPPLSKNNYTAATEVSARTTLTVRRTYSLKTTQHASPCFTPPDCLDSAGGPAVAGGRVGEVRTQPAVMKDEVPDILQG